MTGAAWSAFVDLCADDCAEPGADSSAGTSFRAAIGVQIGGTPIVAINDPAPGNAGRLAGSQLRERSLEVVE